jgi:hypothetical protein
MLLDPAVAYAFTSDKYLVVWEHQHTSPAGSSIIGRMVFADGQLGPSTITVSEDPGGEPRDSPDLAYNRHANEFLVVWNQWHLGNLLWNVHSRLVTAAGGTPSTPQLIDVVTVPGEFPAVAAIPTTTTSYKYLVVWEDWTVTTRWDIRGRLVQENGTPAPSSFHLSTELMDQARPAVAGDEAGQRYFVTWSHTLGSNDMPIHGRAVSAAGDLQYDEAEIGGPVADWPAVAAGSAGTFLVAWGDHPLSGTDIDIYGQFWGNRVSLPLVARNWH